MEDGAAISVTLFGRSGRSVILVHGLASNGRLWWPVARLLAPYCRIAVPDLRGHGSSSGQGGPHSIELAAKDIRRIVEELSLDVVGVAGQSWGAAVAACYAQRYPAGIAVAATVDGVLERLRDRFASSEAMLEALTPPDVSGVSLDALAERLEARYRQFPEGAVGAALGSFFAGPGGEAQRCLPIPDHLRILSDLFDFDMEACLGDMQARLLVIASLSGEVDEDRRKLEISRGVIGRARPGSQLVALIADHDVHLQMPEVVAGQLLAAICGTGAAHGFERGG